jgi:hypothetical protein
MSPLKKMIAALRDGPDSPKQLILLAILMATATVTLPTALALWVAR